MIHYYLDSNNCVYVYNSDTDHWIVKSPKVMYQYYQTNLFQLNSGIKPEDLYCRKIGKTRAYCFLTKQYKNIEDTWEYSGITFKTGSTIYSNESDYNIVYYLGDTYPVKSYRESTNVFILRGGKNKQFEVSATHCSEILKKESNGSYSVYGKTIF